jgi:hypothetical protein
MGIECEGFGYRPTTLEGELRMAWETLTGESDIEPVWLDFCYSFCGEDAVE